MIFEIAGGIILAVITLWAFAIIVALLCSLIGD